MKIAFLITSGILKNKIIAEAKKRNVFKDNQEKIEAYLLYLDQKVFNKKLDKQLSEEIERFMAGKKSIEELIKEKFPEPDFVCPDLPK